MFRIWLLAIGMIVCVWLLMLMGDLGGMKVLLTASAPIGAGLVAAFLVGGGFFSRAVWLIVGVVIGALGFVIGAGVMSDNAFGLALGATITILLMALLTFWTRKEGAFLSAVLGSGSMTAVYAYEFNIDPQSINVSLPIAVGQTILPLGLGFIAGVVCRLFLPDDTTYAARRNKDEAPPEPPDEQQGKPLAPAGAPPAGNTVSGSDILPGGDK